MAENEREYIQITNLAKLRIAREILIDIMPNRDGIDGEKLSSIKDQIAKWIIGIENARLPDEDDEL